MPTRPGRRSSQALHRVLLDGERLEPPKLKGLLNRRPAPKERYDAARRRFSVFPTRTA